MFFRMVYKSAQIFLPFCHNPRVWQTDRRTEFSSQYRVCITCSAVKTAISLQRGHFNPKFEGEVVAPTNHFCTDSYTNECLITLTVFTQRNFVADFFQAKCDFRRKTAVLHFQPVFGWLRTRYDDHVRLIGMRVMDFLLVLSVLFRQVLRLRHRYERISV